MHRVIMLACALALSMVFCCGLCGSLPFFNGGPEDEGTPATAVPTPGRPDPTPPEADRPPLTEAPLLPGLDPLLVLAPFAEDDRMLCSGWEPFWNVWEGYCYTPSPPYPAYGVYVYSRTEDTVDSIQAAVDQRQDADHEVILAFFETLLSLPYEGADPDTILAWVSAELSAAAPNEFITADLTHNGIPYTLSGTLTLAIHLEIGQIDSFIEMP